MSGDTKIYVSYNQVHEIIKKAVAKYRIGQEFQPDLIIAIGGGGFIPARILRTFIKRQGNKNILIQAIGLSLYEDIHDISDESAVALAKATNQVIKTQWLSFGPPVATTLVGKSILIVDEVDDTRTTLSYAVQELRKDIAEQEKKFIKEHPGKKVPETKLGIFVLHNKKKEKKMQLPDESIVRAGRYWAADETADRWIVYPWEAIDIEEHTQKCV
ncbi:6256_t:CDS:2 [Paraglomus brasilianum]|uniref:6256_t:CDS:1 n=1 Tax=Paraglomus brasilianum TaxID=144538 RepID=A0A9N8W1D1_9GLOM|nr:6256_t:CDS:2 [Paraglomus brasilianum]